MGLRCLLRSWRKLHGEVGRIFNPFWIQLIPIENPKSEDLKALLQQVIALDQHRILSRLRSRHAERTRKTAGKQALIAQLNQVICDKSIKARLGFAKSRLTTVREGAQALQVLFTRLESILDPRAKEVEVQKVLGEIVKEAYEFTRENDLSIALQNFSGNPSLKNHLPEAIGKLARYYSAAFELVCAARDKRCRVFQNIEVEPFEIPTPTYIQRSFEKVHAEIQLLFYYELYPDRPRPRIICSSKSACYLCNLFFRFHGGFHVPRTHGRIYEKWILPDWLDVPVERWPGLSIILTRLKATLENKIQRASRSKRYLHPNESFLPPVAHWPSSSALSRNRLSTAPASTSTIRPQSPLIHKEKRHSRLSLRKEMPLTPPRTPLDLPHDNQVSRSDGEHIVAPAAVSLANTCGEDILALDAISLVTVRYGELPYRQSITATAPLLYVQLDGLSLTLEFVQVFSGQLSIARAEDAAMWSKGHQVVDIGDIPTTTELQLNCSDNSNELTIQLQNDQKGIVCFRFVWEGSRCPL
jgi:hypothetical protein